MPSDASGGLIAAMPDPDKIALLSRLCDGDPHVAAELRAKIMAAMAANSAGAPPVAARTVADLRARAHGRQDKPTTNTIPSWPDLIRPPTRFVSRW